MYLKVYLKMYFKMCDVKCKSWTPLAPPEIIKNKSVSIGNTGPSSGGPQKTLPRKDDMRADWWSFC